MRDHNSSHGSSASSGRIIIVGGGYAGTRLARLLDGAADVTLIERRDRFTHNVAAIRAVADPTWLDRIPMVYARLLERGRVVQGEVAQVRSGGVTLADGQRLDADHVVLAPGSVYASPFKPRGAEDHLAYAARLCSVHARLAHAGSVAIVGAGPVGIELAGEIKTAFPDKPVTLISGDARLLPGYRAALDHKLQRDLRAQGVILVMGHRALDLPTSQDPYGPASVALADGSTVEADLIFPVLGATPDTDFLRHAPGVMLSKGRIVVSERLQLPGLACVYALGDAALTEDPQAISGVERQAVYLSKLLKRLLAGGAAGELSPYGAPGKPVIVVPVGLNAGASQLPLSLVLGAWATQRIKGRHLFVAQQRKALGLESKDPAERQGEESAQPEAGPQSQDWRLQPAARTGA